MFEKGHSKVALLREKNMKMTKESSLNPEKDYTRQWAKKCKSLCNLMQELETEK